MNNFELGKWNVICQVCGFKKKSSEIKRRWDGVLVCEEDWEPRHEQDFIRSRSDQLPLPFVSPEPADQYLSSTFNCDTATFIYLPNHIGADTTIYKARIVGPLFVEDCVVTVVCTLEIE